MNKLKIFLAVEGNNIHFLNDLEVILALIKINGILSLLALRIKLGQISESTKKITSGFHKSKNLLIKKPTSKGKNL